MIEEACCIYSTRFWLVLEVHRFEAISLSTFRRFCAILSLVCVTGSAQAFAPTVALDRVLVLSFTDGAAEGLLASIEPNYID